MPGIRTGAPRASAAMKETTMDQNQESPGRGAEGAVGRRSDAVAAELVRMIQSGAFQEGQRLPAERDLMQRYGVSRSAARQATLSPANRGPIRHPLRPPPLPG